VTRIFLGVPPSHEIHKKAFKKEYFCHHFCLSLGLGVAQNFSIQIIAPRTPKRLRTTGQDYFIYEKQ
jgi:hypothetical protein